MRKLFADLVYDRMREDDSIFFLTGDLGMYVLDDIKRDFPKRFINVGAAEQALLDIAVGLSMAGKRVITYTITPFYLRAFETIRTYIGHEKWPILMAASGVDADYAHDGFSHDATDIPRIVSTLGNVIVDIPKTERDLEQGMSLWRESTDNIKSPRLIILRKS